MLDNKDYKQVKEVYVNILKALKNTEDIDSIKTIGGVDLIFKDKKFICIIIVYDYESLKIIEIKQNINTTTAQYSPKWGAIREGNCIIETFNMLENKPNILMIPGLGNIDDKTVRTGSYVGVLLNRPVISISDSLDLERSESGEVMFNNLVKGYVLKTKKFANPIYVTSGFKINIDQALEISKHCLKENKLPEPLHDVHKIAVKLKKEV